MHRLHEVRLNLNRLRCKLSRCRNMDQSKSMSLIEKIPPSCIRTGREPNAYFIKPNTDHGHYRKQ